MSYGTSTRRDAEVLLLEALGDFKTLEEAEVEYDVDQILTECYDEVGCWDVQQVDEDTFSDILRNHHIYQA